MLIFRITKKQYLNNLNGLGGSYEDGARWNKPGTPVLYFGMSAAVAMLEMANYTSTPRMAPPSFRLGIYEIADDTPIDRLEPEDWPEGWSQFPAPESTQEIGDQWLEKGGSFGLIVPSCAVSGGLGEVLVVNPRHSGISDVRLVEERSDIFNPRAFPGTDHKS
ncbi:RES domain-containing protein [Marinobacter sp. LV10R510-11A]|uniref:RES family NAD+ phosphorylase n=1 Tax=Marinobacter sp. LV10R510-11A TaxID=1415568 RepID=UPI000BB8B01D|nr:RES family NAD+ phosphorylase [Marinobacter sp. LV10R510-11A]SOB74780.1 RES domain-containing protein [Marinobacter sp. LV10R510-11A]